MIPPHRSPEARQAHTPTRTEPNPGRAHNASQARGMTLWPPLCCYAGNVSATLHHGARCPALVSANTGSYPTGAEKKRFEAVTAKNQTAPLQMRGRGRWQLAACS